jgi:tetratricopeptide (TPR) repeat protein
VTTDPTATREDEPRPSEDERWYLDDEREFLIRSLDDAGREHDAGDLTDDDFAVLTTRDRRRLAEVERELAALGVDLAALEVAGHPDSGGGPVKDGQVGDGQLGPWSGWRRIGIIAACFLVLAGVVILVVHAVTPRLPGQATSGSITASKQQLIEQQLAGALSLNNAGNAVGALKLYDKVLAEDPDDPQALAASGFIDWNYGSAGGSTSLESAGRKAEEKAIRAAPTFYAGHLFLGLILFNQDHNAAAAVKQFNLFLSDSSPTGEVASVASLIRGAYTQAGVAVPAALAAKAG